MQTVAGIDLLGISHVRKCVDRNCRGEEVARIPSIETGAFTRHFGKVEWRCKRKTFCDITRFAIFPMMTLKQTKINNDYSKFLKCWSSKV